MEEVEIERAEEPLPVRIVSKNDFLRRVARRMRRTISRYVPRVVVPISPYRFAARHLFYTVLTLPLLILSPVLALLIHPGFFLLLIVPVIMFFTPWLRLKSMIGDRKRAVDDELPFFTVHAAIAQSAGLDLYESLCSTIGKGVFEQIERGAEFVKRKVAVSGKSRTGALDELGKNHPHDGMKSLLLGYTSEYHAGGDLKGFLEDKADEYLRKTRRKWDKYLKDVTTVAEIVISVLLIFPVLVLMTIFFSPGTSFSMGFGFVTVGIPLAGVACYAIIRSSQPKDYSKYQGNLYLPLLIVPITALILSKITSSWVMISSVIGVGLLSYGLPVFFQRRRIRAEESSLPQFLRDVTEYRKLDYPLKKAVETLWEEGKYSSEFNKLLDHVVKRLGMGDRLSKVEIPTRSWLVKLSFFHLGQVAETGGFTVKSMELLTNFMNRVKEAKDEARTSLWIHRGLSIATPLLLALIVGSMIAMFSIFSTPEVVGTSPQLGTLPEIWGGTPPHFLGLASAIILSSSVMMGFLMTYAATFTQRETVWMSVNAFLAAEAIYAMPTIASTIGGLLGVSA